MYEHNDWVFIYLVPFLKKSTVCSNLKLLIENFCVRYV